MPLDTLLLDLTNQLIGQIPNSLSAVIPVVVAAIGAYTVIRYIGRQTANNQTNTQTKGD